MTISIAEAVLHGAHILRKSGVPEARLEAGSLLADVLGRDRTFILSHADEVISSAQEERFRKHLSQRAQGRPLQYITGHQEFYGLDFEVNADVLIPRPETEMMVEAALKLAAGWESSPLICDVGTGSGCIAIALLHELSRFPEARAIAIDVSETALAVAARNAAKHSLLERITFVRSDCLAELGPPKARFDLIVSNPPYVAEHALAGLQREVRDYEPRVALEGGADGLSVIRRLLTQAASFTKAGGYLLFEIGFDQHEAINNLIDRNTWQLLDIHQDLQGIPRTVALKKLEVATGEHG